MSLQFLLMTFLSAGNSLQSTPPLQNPTPAAVAVDVCPDLGAQYLQENFCFKFLAEMNRLSKAPQQTTGHAIVGHLKRWKRQWDANPLQYLEGLRYQVTIGASKIKATSGSAWRVNVQVKNPSPQRNHYQINNFFIDDVSAGHVVHSDINDATEASLLNVLYRRAYMIALKANQVYDWSSTSHGPRLIPKESLSPDMQEKMSLLRSLPDYLLENMKTCESEPIFNDSAILNKNGVASSPHFQVSTTPTSDGNWRTHWTRGYSALERTIEVDSESSNILDGIQDAQTLHEQEIEKMIQGEIHRSEAEVRWLDGGEY